MFIGTGRDRTVIIYFPVVTYQDPPPPPIRTMFSDNERSLTTPLFLGVCGRGGCAVYPYGRQEDRIDLWRRWCVLSWSLVIQCWKRRGGANSWHTKMPASIICTSGNYCARFCRPKVAKNTLMTVGLGYYILALALEAIIGILLIKVVMKFFSGYVFKFQLCF